MKKLVSPILRASVSLVLIVILLYIMRDKYNEIIGVLKRTNISMFGLGLIAFILALTVASFRLKLIIEAQGTIPINFFEAVSLTFIGYFFNNFLPTAIGGDVVKAYHLSKKTVGKVGSFTAIFVDRAIGLFTMIFMAFIALLFVENQLIDKTVKHMIYAITAISIAAIIFMMNKNFAKKLSGIFVFFLKAPVEVRLKNLYNAINNYRDNTALIFQSIAISAISQILFFASIGILAVSIGSHIPIMDILLRMPIISAMSLLPSINGLGLREGGTVLLFGPMIGKEKAFAVSILWLFILLIVSLIGGLVYALSSQFKAKLKEIE